MNSILIPDEKEFKQWVKEVLKEFFSEHPAAHLPDGTIGEPFLSRAETATFLDISLVTLDAWMKKGLPFHKQPGKVYFLKSEVVEYIKTKAPVATLLKVMPKINT